MSTEVLGDGDNVGVGVGLDGRVADGLAVEPGIEINRISLVRKN